MKNRLGIFLGLVIFVIVMYNMYTWLGGKTIAVVAISLIGIAVALVVAMVSAAGAAHRSYDAEPITHTNQREEHLSLSA